VSGLDVNARKLLIFAKSFRFQDVFLKKHLIQHEVRDNMRKVARGAKIAPKKYSSALMQHEIEYQQHILY
jgi:hypothetical protein